MTSEEYYKTEKGLAIIKRNEAMYKDYKAGISKVKLKVKYNLSATRVTQIISRMYRYNTPRFLFTEIRKVSGYLVYEDVIFAATKKEAKEEFKNLERVYSEYKKGVELMAKVTLTEQIFGSLKVKKLTKPDGH